ncbi:MULTISPECIES: ABC transporter substrate-binding protein [Actinomadura]|uniref:ABC transporter substrate-binding protein n=1 Tax=Actinomadura litoris TaxID=2678616 RepID=A0A7K1KYU3_9ACTN|nr:MULTISPECIES: ABC transporter substrate-binding protein [Actinomadura]MBT2212281.1 ABC transporter substrate-binding protein [Actinomadura sp. NEAU-AAG7]MUN37227.1 ABC transporter substrate-binding protein [Actinomadura litoris]
MLRVKRHLAVVACSGIVSLLAGCSGGSTVDDDAGGGGADAPTKVSAGYVSAIDQLGLPAGVEAGYFDDQNLNVKLADPFPTGVDALNALQAGQVDFVQVGTPAIAAAQKGLDLVLVGNYTGAASRLSIDDTMAVVASAKSGVDGGNLTTLRGKRIGVSEGSINHLYLLGLLEKTGLKAGDVKIVNTEPPDMAVALRSGGIDVAIVWDPFPITIARQVDGAKEVLRGGGHIPFVGYIVTTPKYAQEHPDVVSRFLTARATTDQWMRQNPDKAADAATRWLPGTKKEVAAEAMKHNVKQLDPRFSACNYLALDTVARLLAAQGKVKPGFDVNKLFRPGPILKVMSADPKLFQDLPATPASAKIQDGYTFERTAAEKACPS